MPLVEAEAKAKAKAKAEAEKGLQEIEYQNSLVQNQYEYGQRESEHVK